MTGLELITVPYNSAGRPGGVAAGPDALRAAGLAATLRRHAELTDEGDAKLVPPDPVRGPSGLVAEESLAQLVDEVRRRTAVALRAGRLPLLVGGDCPVLLGGLAAVREQAGEVGLLFVDGHEDAWPPARSTTGEAADCELGLALGWYTADLPLALARQLPLVRPEAVTAFGPRDADELADEAIESLEGAVTLTRPEAIHAAHARGQLGAWTSRQAARLAGLAGQWWLHVDLDVLATEELAAVDYPQPGGLSWAELDVIASTALASPGCAGWSVCIYNPELDPERIGAARILGYLDRALAGGKQP